MFVLLNFFQFLSQIHLNISILIIIHIIIYILVYFCGLKKGSVCEYCLGALSGWTLFWQIQFWLRILEYNDSRNTYWFC